MCCRDGMQFVKPLARVPNVHCPPLLLFRQTAGAPAAERRSWRPTGGWNGVGSWPLGLMALVQLCSGAVPGMSGFRSLLPVHHDCTGAMLPRGLSPCFAALLLTTAPTSRTYPPQVRLVAHGMGARLVFHCLLELCRQGARGVVQHAVLMGCPVRRWRGGGRA